MQPTEQQPGTGPADTTPDQQDATTADNEVGHPRRIRSFVRRAGRTSTGQQRAIDDLGPRFLLPYAEAPLDWDATFGRTGAKRIFEIGFGMGETTAHIAQLRPDDDFLGVEVHEPAWARCSSSLASARSATSASFRTTRWKCSRR